MNAIESSIRDAHAMGDFDRALTVLVEGYGRELLSFLCARAQSDDLGGELFAATCEKLWRGIAGFSWRSSARGWAYAVAKNVLTDHFRSPHERPERKQSLSQLGEASAVVERVRTETARYRKTETKNRMQKLREQLPGDDQTLLILRVDRQLPWAELAQIMAERPLDDAELKRESARLRQRFQAVKTKLRALAKDAGLL